MLMQGFLDSIQIVLVWITMLSCGFCSMLNVTPDDAVFFPMSCTLSYFKGESSLEGCVQHGEDFLTSVGIGEKGKSREFLDQVGSPRIWVSNRL